MNTKWFKYLTSGEEDREWGLFLTVAGCAEVKENVSYPPSEHPSGYYFTWGKGRVIQEYQLLYITEGEGVFENQSGKFQVRAGSIIIIRPFERHRYRPKQERGWYEYYVGFNGRIAESLLSQNKFFADSPVVHIGIHEDIVLLYQELLDLVEGEGPGYHQIGAGIVMKLLGTVIAFTKRRVFHDEPIVRYISEIKANMLAHVSDNIDLQAMAMEYGVGYDQLRKQFKQYTGVSPHQYFLEMKIMRARELIVSTDKTIQEISYELGFDSIYYFSRLFKKKTGVSPTTLRNV